MDLERFSKTGAALLGLWLLVSPAINAEGSQDFFNDFAKEVQEQQEEFEKNQEETKQKMEAMQKDAERQQEKVAQRVREGHEVMDRAQKIVSVIFKVIIVLMVLAFVLTVFLLWRAYKNNYKASQQFRGFPPSEEGRRPDSKTVSAPDEDDGFAPPPSK